MLGASYHGKKDKTMTKLSFDMIIIDDPFENPNITEEDIAKAKEKMMFFYQDWRTGKIAEKFRTPKDASTELGSCMVEIETGKPKSKAWGFKYD